MARTDTFVLVRDPALCRKATEAVSEYVDVPADSFTIVLLRIRANYVAESDRSLGAFQNIFVFDSTMALLVPRDSLVSFSNVPTPATESLCFGPEHDFSKSIGGKIRFVLTSPRQQWYRDLLGLQGIPVDSVHHVSDDTMCARAIAAIRAHHQRGIEHVQLTLFRVGRFHWAETNWPRAGEWTLVWILDSMGTRVIGQY